MMSLRTRVIAVVPILVATHTALAQERRVTIRGVAYDSLRGRPLASASIAIAGGARQTLSDARGQFEIAGVPPGSYTLVMRHATLDSVGLNEISARATVTDGRDLLRLAVPSFPTLWRAACGGARPPRDSGFVYGVIRDASSMEPIANASIEVTWSNLLVDRSRGLMQRRWHLQTRSEARGSYALCGVPAAQGLRIQATTTTAASGVIDLPPGYAQRRDLLLGTAPADSSRGGTISGLVTDDGGQSFADARIVMDGVSVVRSGADGRFTLANVPAGTRQIEVRTLGVMPAAAVVDVLPGETVTVALTVARLATLRAMHVTAPVAERRSAYEFEVRRRTGGGYTMDSVRIATYARFINVFHDVPSVQVQYDRASLRLAMPDGRGGQCLPDIRIDGAEAALGHLVDLRSDEVAGLEVYPHAGSIPLQFLNAGTRPLCGAILVWTKYGFRNR